MEKYTYFIQPITVALTLASTNLICGYNGVTSAKSSPDRLSGVRHQVIKMFQAPY